MSHVGGAQARNNVRTCQAITSRPEDLSQGTVGRPGHEPPAAGPDNSFDWSARSSVSSNREVPTHAIKALDAELMSNVYA